MGKPEIDPERAPSGKEARGYGEIMVHVWVTEDTAEAMVEGHQDMPFTFYEVAASHLMSLVAANDADGYKEAVNRLAKTALSNKGMMMIKSSEDDDEKKDL